jgi:FKBP-type peptidyl-prolyl cis-trans isomerase SlyD
MSNSSNTPRKVGANTVVTAEFWISDSQGTPLDDSDGPVVFLHRGQDSLLPRLDDAIEGQEPGFDNIFHLEPEDAFGDYDAELVRVEPRDRFPEPLEVGMQFEGVPGNEDDDDDGPLVTEDDGEPSDDEDALVFTVTDLAEDRVVLDANHPYAGMSLRVRIKVLDVRPAEPDEVEQGFAFGDEDDEDEEQVLDALLDARRRPDMLH